MAIDLTPEQRQVGEQNFKEVGEKLGLNRRDFLKGGLLGLGAAAGSAAAVYFGYRAWDGNPVKAALIGAGDEGGVLVGEHNPAFIKFVAVCDVRPSNMQRIFDGDPAVPLRKGFKKVCGIEAANEIKKFDEWAGLEEELRKNKEIEALVIALPLHWHAWAAIKAMKVGQERGKPIHVLCEKLMAWNIKQCKQMIKVAKETGSILSIGHQRHYSLVYSHAQEVLKAGVLGDVKHIRALWHRNFSWPYYPEGVNPDNPMASNVKGIRLDRIVPRTAQVVEVDRDTGSLTVGGRRHQVPLPALRDGWFQPVLKSEYEALEERASAQGLSVNDLMKKYGFKDVEQLVRWRLYQETGGGLMAELGSHQLDACSIFLGKVKPLTVQGIGHRSFFGPGKNDRDIDDHVFVTFEFPGKNHPRGPAGGKKNDPKDVVVVTYSSVSTNSFEQYGECLMGTRGSMVVEAEQRVMLYPEKNPLVRAAGTNRTMSVNVASLGQNQAAAEAMSTWGGVAAATPGVATSGASAGAASRGYREEMEDFAYCIRLLDGGRFNYDDQDDQGHYKGRLPRCHGEVAMADAIVALTSNRAMREGKRVTFKEDWFKSGDEYLGSVPDDPKALPKVPVDDLLL
jgi:predicted dehydrogenase